MNIRRLPEDPRLAWLVLAGVLALLSIPDGRGDEGGIVVAREVPAHPAGRPAKGRATTVDTSPHVVTDAALSDGNGTALAAGLQGATELSESESAAVRSSNTAGLAAGGLGELQRAAHVASGGVRSLRVDTMLNAAPAGRAEGGPAGPLLNDLVNLLTSNNPPLTGH